MVTVNEARIKIEQHTIPLSPVLVPIIDSLGAVLSRDIEAPIDSPPFDQSAMDGYAFRWSDLQADSHLVLQGVVAAGDTFETSLLPHHCLRIFTGAAIPQGADTIIIQENCRNENGRIYMDLSSTIQGANIRLAASQCKRGTLIPLQGSILQAGGIGYLAGMGISELSVLPKPRIGIIVTGKELVTPGTTLQYGQIYESNAWMLMAALREGGIHVDHHTRVGDDLQETIEAIREEMMRCDVILLSGGISVGDYDLVREALFSCGVEEIFYKVKQKPGKPLFFGKKSGTLIFALPGNPASVLTCFYQYVVPALRKMQGLSFDPPRVRRLLMHDYFKKGSLTHFLKAKVDDHSVIILDGQESYKLNAFIEANALVMLEPDQQQFQKGDSLEVLPLNTIWRSSKTELFKSASS
jgi:molybdopterin molybdotransferase